MKTHLPTDADLWRAPIVLVALVALLASAIPAAAAADGLIFLPGATSAEGIAVGAARPSTQVIFLRRYLSWRPPAPDGEIVYRRARRQDGHRHEGAPARRLAVRGGRIHRRGVLSIARLRGRRWPCTSSLRRLAAIINDVAVTQGGAWFTDSAQPEALLRPCHPTGFIGCIHNARGDRSCCRNRWPVQSERHCGDTQRRHAYRGPLGHWQALHGQSTNWC